MIEMPNRHNSPNNASGDRKNGSSKNVRKGDKDQNMVQCDVCQRWELFENCGLGEKFDEKKVNEVKFVCRFCKQEALQNELKARQDDFEKKLEDKLTKMNSEIRTIRDKIDAAVKQNEEDIKSVQDRLHEFVEKIKRSERETSVATFFESNEKLEDQLKKIQEETASKLTVNALQCEETVEQLRKTVQEVADKVMRKEWPTPSECKSRDIKIRRNESAHPVLQTRRLGFGEQYKSKAKDTIVVIGDSLVREVGKRLEIDNHMFTSASKGGATIETIEEEIRKLPDCEDRHLIVMVGTNNIKNDGSEVVWKKYESLIATCKSIKNRLITFVGIPRRYDLSNLQNSRRLAINTRLRMMCRGSGMKYLDYECDRNRLGADGLHFNNKGQIELAQRIFTHSTSFLL